MFNQRDANFYKVGNALQLCSSRKVWFCFRQKISLVKSPLKCTCMIILSGNMYGLVLHCISERRVMNLVSCMPTWQIWIKVFQKIHLSFSNFSRLLTTIIDKLRHIEAGITNPSFKGHAKKFSPLRWFPSLAKPDFLGAWKLLSPNMLEIVPRVVDLNGATFKSTTTKPWPSWATIVIKPNLTRVSGAVLSKCLPCPLSPLPPRVLSPVRSTV